MNRKNIFATYYKNTTAALLGLLLILVSCHREEIPTEDTSLKGNAPIEFSEMTGILETKAGGGENTSALPDNFTNFMVWAQNGTNYTVFDEGGTVVTKSGSEDDNTLAWTYSPVRYWQSGDYTFYAISPSSKGTGKLSGQGLEISFKNETNNIAGWDLSTDQTDLLATCQTVSGTDQQTNEDGPDKVELTFNHMLSKIKFSARSTEGNDIEIKVTKVEIYGNSKIAEGLTGNTSSKPWEFATDITTTKDKPYINKTYEESEYINLTNEHAGILPELLVFPETFDKTNVPTIAVTYTINGSEKTKSARIIHNEEDGTTWLPGKIYDYKLSISADKITFAEPTVTPWADGGSADNDKIEF